MDLKPWYKIVTPREDLREGKPLDAAEFAVHLDQVREKRAPDDYQNPERFFERTYITKNLLGFSAEVVRRLSGLKTETSAVFNMATQFGGGKTHALTLLFHLAENGPASHPWPDVERIKKKAGINSVPEAATAVFVGTEFDSVTGRGGNGEPVRKTPWGDIAYQLGGPETFSIVEEHEKQQIAPGGDVIRRLLPNDRPCLILMDELMNYVSRYRKSGLATQLYDFVHNLSETARGEDNVVLAVSIPASELEMSAEDEADYERFKKMLDRLGKAVVMAAEEETSEIIRRRLFEWGGLPGEARKVASEYGDWVIDHRQQVPSWFAVDHARETFEATYPFHPTVLSVFERKWQALPNFQRTRGILRLLALWVSNAYEAGFKGAHRDALIGLGTAPLDDPMFRAAAFEQLGEQALEGPVTTDVCGKRDAHAVRMDEEAVDTIKEARLHRKVATTIFFESNGGQTRTEATVPEIRLSVAEPDLDIGNIETVLEGLGTNCYFLSVEGNRYRFSLTPNLNKLLADRRATVNASKIEERIRTEIQKVVTAGKELQVIPFPEKSSDIPDRPVLALVAMAPEHSMQESDTLDLIEKMTREYGRSDRTFKNALIFAVPEDSAPLREDARKVIAWENIQHEEDELRLDDSQKRRLQENLKKAKRDLKECVWRSYKNLVFLGKGNGMQHMDLGLLHSSSGDTLVSVMLERLREKGEVEIYIGPRALVKNWPPAFNEWSTKGVRDAIFASPQFPKLLEPDSITQTIARGVSSKKFAYVGKSGRGKYEPFFFGEGIMPGRVEIADDMFIIPAEEAKKHIEPPELSQVTVTPESAEVELGKKQTFMAKGLDQYGQQMPLETVEWEATGGTVDEEGVYTAGEDEGSFFVKATADGFEGSATVRISETPTSPPPPPSGEKALSWSGEVPPQKWMNFYTKVLSRFSGTKGLKLVVRVEAAPEDGVTDQQVEETKTALRELGLNDDISLQDQ